MFFRRFTAIITDMITVITDTITDITVTHYKMGFPVLSKRGAVCGKSQIRPH